MYNSYILHIFNIILLTQTGLLRSNRAENGFIGSFEVSSGLQVPMLSSAIHQAMFKKLSESKVANAAI